MGRDVLDFRCFIIIVLNVFIGKKTSSTSIGGCGCFFKVRIANLNSKDYQNTYNYNRHVITIDQLTSFIQVKQFRIDSFMNLAIKDYIAAVVSMFLGDIVGDYIIPKQSTRRTTY